jgi:hypothetical protein
VWTGRGIYTWANGDRYDGQFKDGKKHGTGRINFTNGEKYTGNWIEDERTGRGVFTWPNGDRYEMSCSQISHDYISRSRLTDLHTAYAINE